MKLLQVVPDSPYMIWQLYVQMQNFRDYNVEKDAVVLVAVSTNTQLSDEMKKLMEWSEAKFIIYEDTRISRVYTSSIRPHLLAKYFKDYPDLGAYMYHDQDIIFRRAPEIEPLKHGDINYVARSGHNYTGYDYMMGFKKYQFYSFCEICQIQPEQYEKNKENAGGAQYILKNTDHKFWEWCELKCEQVYRYYQDITKMGLRTWFPEEHLPPHHVQIWATDMYVLLAAMIHFGKTYRWAEAIDFCWPFNPSSNDKAIMHNAGVTAQNEFFRSYSLTAADGTVLLEKRPDHECIELQKKHPGSIKSCAEEYRVLFNKSTYHVGNYPFGEDLSYVKDTLAQKDYTDIIERLSIIRKSKNENIMSKQKIIAIFCTNNKINPDLLKLTLGCLKKAADNATLAEVVVVTNSWEPIQDNPFQENAMISPFKVPGSHLNYVMQLKQVLAKHDGGIVSIHEHDVMYPPNYFDEMIRNWDFQGRYGVWNNNYIGMNETGYLKVVNRHQPFSLLAIATFKLRDELAKKVDECLQAIDPGHPFGWCYIEPHIKEEFVISPHTDVWPAIHVNMNHLGEWHTGAQGKNHHFTNHCEVCYAKDSEGVTDRPQDWGDYRKYFTFDLAGQGKTERPLEAK